MADTRGSNRKLLKIGSFLGVDLTHSPENVDSSRSPNGTNMIRSVPGSIRKRMGYEVIRDYGSRINGLARLGTHVIVHAGSSVYVDGSLLGSADDNFSTFLANGESLCMLDGEKLRIIKTVGGTVTISDAQSGATVPTISISRSPSGQGTRYEPVNLLSNERTDSFLGTADAVNYQLSFDNLTDAVVSARKLTANGWLSLSENIDFSVIRSSGTVVFTSAPGASPLIGEDNVTITYSVDESEGAAKINGCTCAIFHGLGGVPDRLFVSGNPSCASYDFHSAQGDVTYFGDTWYTAVGNSHSPVVGYSVIAGQLATHKKNDDNERNILLRSGSLDSQDRVQFLFDGVIQGAGAIAKRSIVNLSEPLFLSAKGICAAAPYVYNSERYVQDRGYFIGGSLLAQENLQDSCACAWHDMYLLATGGKIYVLDTLQKTRPSNSSLSEYSYEAYLLDGIDARVLLSDERLWFGTSDGKLCRFFADESLAASYCDDGEPISARWDVEFAGSNFYKNKSLRYLALRMTSSPQTSVNIFARVKGQWRQCHEDTRRAGYIDFNNIDFDRMSFSTDRSPRVIGTKLAIKKFDSVRLSFRNTKAREPFGISQLALEFSEGNNYKG